MQFMFSVQYTRFQFAHVADMSHVQYETDFVALAVSRLFSAGIVYQLYAVHAQLLNVGTGGVGALTFHPRLFLTSHLHMSTRAVQFKVTICWIVGLEVTLEPEYASCSLFIRTGRSESVGRAPEEYTYVSLNLAKLLVQLKRSFHDQMLFL
jgi:hypothetical protein